MRRRRLLLMIVFAVVALGALLSAVRSQGYLQFLELAAYDLLVSRAQPRVDAPLAVALVLIDETDIQSLGNWPLNDEQLREVLQQVLAYDPVVVGVDIYRDLAVPPGHASLQALLRDDPRIIAIEKFPEADRPGVPAPPILRDTQRVGFSDLLTDRGGIARRNLLFQSNAERTGFAFSLRLALAYLAERDIHPMPDADNPAYMRLGPVTFVPLGEHYGGYRTLDDGGYQTMLRYRSEPSPFTVHTLRALDEGRVPPGAFAGRVVILGVAAEGVKDYFATPFAILEHARGMLAGSVVHAHATQQFIDAALLGRDVLHSWDEPVEFAWLWAWLVAGFLVGWFAGPSWRFVLFVLIGAVAAVAVAVLAFRAGWWVPLVPNLLAWMFAAALSSALLAAHRHRDQQALMSLFSRHVSPQVADTIWQRRDQVLADGRVIPRTFAVTTLFTDLQGFTAISERMPPEAFLEWLNSYLGALTDVIMRTGGVLDDFAGDGIKASFGVPFCEPGEAVEQARRAVHCALALGVELTSLNRRWRDQGRDGVAMRIGIHTGPVVVGTVGSASRMKYTTVGRNVNLASRLECLKESPCPDPLDDARNCRILVSADTAALVAAEFELQDMGLYDLRGITEPVRVFQIVGPKSEE